MHSYFLNFDIKLSFSQAIPAENRAQLIQDSFAFSEARIIDAVKTFEMIQYLQIETDELVWLAFMNRVEYFYYMFVSTSTYGDFQIFMSNLIKPYYSHLGWEEKPTDSWIER